MTTNEMMKELVAKAQDFNALTKLEEKTKAYKPLTELLKELNKSEDADFYIEKSKAQSTPIDYFKTMISLTAFDVEKNDDGIPCKITLSTKRVFVDPYKVLKSTGINAAESILNYGARYYALLQCQKLGINPDKSVKLVGKQFLAHYCGKKQIAVENLSVTKVCKECLQPVFDTFKIGLNANNIDVKFIDIGMAKHGKEAGQVVISNQKTYGKLIAEVLYCRLNGVKYTIA